MKLCLLTNLTSSEWAAWVQAIGSIAAILAAAGIAIWQARQQHKSSLVVLRDEHRLAATEAAKTLLALSTNCLKALTHVSGQFPDRDAVHRIAAQEAHLDFNEVRVIEGAVLSIQLHSLPSTLVSLAMIVGSTVRQFREKVESALQHHRNMDANAFQDFFKTLDEMQRSLKHTCSDIEAEVQRLQNVA